MNRPWKIWLTFLAALGLLVGAVGWLSIKAVQSEDAETAANRQAKVDEKASLALWRMDSFMTPLVAQESARPYFMYESFYSNERVGGRAGKGKVVAEFQIPSPLLTESTPYVLLHFQCDPQQQLTSPEVPQGKIRQQASDYLSDEQIRTNGEVLTDLHKTINWQDLVDRLPTPDSASAIVANAAPLPNSATINYPLMAANSSQPSINNAGQNAQPSQRPENASGDARAQHPSVSNSVLPNSTGSNVPAPNAPPPISQEFNNGSQPQAQGTGTVSPAQSGGQALNPLAQNSSQAANPPAQFLGQQQATSNQLDYQARAKSFVQSNLPSQLKGDNNFNGNNDASQSTSEAQMTMMTPLWLAGDLVLARRVNIAGRDYIQGCLLDWPALKRQMLDDVRNDLLPQADLQPVSDPSATAEVRRLASLPVTLIPGSLPIDEIAAGVLSPIKLSLLVAWGAMLLAAVAVATLLAGVISLSERRGAFVSAVTHELRTPLTTFRMYAEMLSEGMVREETDKRHYLQTLRVEADRLTHLVANVLAYARLERGRPGGRIEKVTVERLLEVATQRLADRAAQASLQLSIEPADGVMSRGVLADPAAVEQILFNLVDNACKYAVEATDRTLHLSATAENGRVLIRLRDHGAGVLPGEERRLFQPFRKSARDAAHSAPGVGLGLALSQRLARDMHGDLCYEPTVAGACFVLSLPLAT